MIIKQIEGTPDLQVDTVNWFYCPDMVENRSEVPMFMPDEKNGDGISEEDVRRLSGWVGEVWDELGFGIAYGQLLENCFKTRLDSGSYTGLYLYMAVREATMPFLKRLAVTVEMLNEGQLDMGDHRVERIANWLEYRDDSYTATFGSFQDVNTLIGDLEAFF